MTQYFVALRQDPTIWPSLKKVVERDNAPTIQFKDATEEAPAHAIVICTAVTGSELGLIRFTPDWPENRTGEPPEHLMVHAVNILWILESEKEKGPIGFAVTGS